MNDRSDPPPGDMVQIHLLTAYPASLLNRDDAGLAKRIPFGGVPRIRVSSQCLKKHWRDAEAIRSLGDQADRSIRVFEDRVAKKLQTEHDASPEAARSVATHLMKKTVDTEVDEKYKDGQVYTKQLLVLTRAETDWLAELGAEILARVEAAGGNPTDEQALEDAYAPNKDKKLRKELEERLSKLAASVDTAMFGRMVTSDLFARVDAAVGVAHAFTTHREAAETDYFTAVDTLKRGTDDAGAALIQETELTSGVFYVYAVIDMNQLRENLGGDGDRADAMARALVWTMATVSPGAKRGSTAPYARAELVLLERGEEQPRSLANAFLDPIGQNGNRDGGVMPESVEALARYRADLEGMYGSFDGTIALSTIHSGAAEKLRQESVPLAAALDGIFGSAA